MNNRILGLASTLLVVGATTNALAASVQKKVEVKAPADKVWAMIGAFCSIKDWHPAIGKCAEADKVRTLVTKDGKATFVEKEVARDDKQMMYTYTIEKSPLPLTGYKGTLQVTPNGDGASTVQWSSNFTPDQGKEEDMKTTLGGVYQAGLDNIQKTAGK